MASAPPSVGACLSAPAFVRHVVLDRWFLHRHQPALGLIHNVVCRSSGLPELKRQRGGKHMKSRWSGVLAIAGMLLAGVSVAAHHSFAAEFDINKPVTLAGTVTKVEWVNPHVYVYLDVKDASGKVTPWSLSSLGPAPRAAPA